MVKLISFGADAGHLMERLLTRAGIGEVGPLTVEVQPEADPEVLDLLREAAEGRWTVRAMDVPGEIDRVPGDDIRLEQADHTGIAGEVLDFETGKPDGSYVFRGWGTIAQLHVY